MTNEQILQKAIEKAKANGWDKENDLINQNLFFGVSEEVTQKTMEVLIGDTGSFMFGLIFRHDFAKAFWGKGDCTIHNGDCLVPNWMHHLQQMVLEENPLQYLEEYL